MARALIFVGLVCLAFTAAGAASIQADNLEVDEAPGRQLLTNGYWAWYPSQTQVQVGGNVAKNTGTANQQNNQQAVQQWGWGNQGGNSNSQSITTAADPGKPVPDPAKPLPPGRKLLTNGYWSWVPSQTQVQIGGNYAQNTGTANQQNNQQALQQWGNSNSGGNINSQSINTAPAKPMPDPAKPLPPGRKLLTNGQWVWFPSQEQFQFGGNVAKNTGTANQQNNQQALQQAGAWNYGVNSNSQSINTAADPGKPIPAAKP